MKKYTGCKETPDQLRAKNGGNTALTFGFTEEEARLPLASGWYTIIFWPNGMACSARRNLSTGDMIVCSFDGVRKIYKGKANADPQIICEDFADEWRAQYRVKQLKSA